MTQPHNVREGAKIKAARRLRKNLTPPEHWLWLRLRERALHGLTFRNQHPLGTYILDFYCPKAKLCVEVDGEIHTRDKQRAHDALRDARLETMGVYVYRINAADVLRDPDEAANTVVDLARSRIELTPPTA